MTAYRKSLMIFRQAAARFSLVAACFWGDCGLREQICQLDQMASPSCVV